MNKIFEVLMLLSFGAAWPASILRSYRSRSTKGKSLAFMFIVLFGYACGIVNNVVNTPNYVLAFYFLDCAMVSIDLTLYYRNRRIEKAEEALLAHAAIEAVETVADAEEEISEAAPGEQG